MTQYREIIRLTGFGFSQRNIMASCDVSQKTRGGVDKKWDSTGEGIYSFTGEKIYC